METSSTSGVGQQDSQTKKPNNSLNNLDLDQFLKLMISELQNQDPMEPMKNSEIMQQVTQIREIESNTRLNQTLGAVQLGQNLASASSMLDKQIRALADGQNGQDGKYITGRVDGVSIENGVPKLRVGENRVALNNITEILSEAAPATGG
ncbi:MAG: flagellar hook assembly protein FlgD [Pirellulales bacterium]|jgi:flagellar basal-body rod modification protein FlgD